MRPIRGLGSARRWFASGVGAVSIVAIVVAAGADGYPVHRPRLLAGAAWLPSTAVGELMLLDGSTAEIAARVPVSEPGHQLDAVQRDGGAYAVDRTAGTLWRIDPATFVAGPQATPLPGAGAGLTVVAADSAVYAVDTERGILGVLDPGTAQRRGDPVTVSSRIGAHGLQVDRDGQLWVLDDGTGDLVRVDGAGRHVRHGAASPGAGALVIADGEPVLVDAQARTATVIDRADGSAGHSTALDLRPDDTPRTAGALNDRQVYVMTARGALTLCDLRQDQCSRAVAVGGPGSDFGTPVESTGRVFVPDYATGMVWVVDVAAAKVVANPKILDPRIRFQLLTRDRIVFFNDPAGDQAGVIRLDGTVNRVSKYDAKKTVPKPTATPSGTPTSTPSAQPTKTPTKTPTAKPTVTPTVTPSRGPTTPATVRIVASKAAATIGETVTLRTETPAGLAVSGAEWRFGDGGTSAGTTVTHAWGAAGTYQVAVTVTFADGRTATTSATVTVRAVAVPQSTLTLQVQGAGTVSVGSVVCPPACTVTADRGSRLNLTAQPAGGAHLSAWSGACTGSTPACTVTLDADLTASASFAGTLAAPRQYSPTDGYQFHNAARTARIEWFAVPGAARYEVELLRNGAPWQTLTSTALDLTITWPADDQGQWRVTAIGADGVRGASSPFWSFSWNLNAITAFAGTWNNLNPGDPRRARVTVTSSETGTLELEYCDSGTCRWNTVGLLRYENVTLTHYQEDVEHPTYRLTVSGGQLTIRKTYSGNRGPNATYVMGR